MNTIGDLPSNYVDIDMFSLEWVVIFESSMFCACTVPMTIYCASSHTFFSFFRSMEPRWISFNVLLCGWTEISKWLNSVFECSNSSINWTLVRSSMPKSRIDCTITLLNLEMMVVVVASSTTWIVLCTLTVFSHIECGKSPDFLRKQEQEAPLSKREWMPFAISVGKWLVERGMTVLTKWVYFEAS